MNHRRLSTSSYSSSQHHHQGVLTPIDFNITPRINDFDTANIVHVRLRLPVSLRPSVPFENEDLPTNDDHDIQILNTARESAQAQNESAEASTKHGSHSRKSANDRKLKKTKKGSLSNNSSGLHGASSIKLNSSSALSASNSNKLHTEEIKFPRDDLQGRELYIGEVISMEGSKRVPHGEGKLIFRHGMKIYIGQFVKGNIAGMGSFEDYRTGIRYVGHWKDNKPHGFGRLKFRIGFTVAEAKQFHEHRHQHAISPIENCALHGKKNTHGSLEIKEKDKEKNALCRCEDHSNELNDLDMGELEFGSTLPLIDLSSENLTYNSFVSPGPGHLEEYSGEFFEGKFRGVGFAVYTNGVRYEGDWLFNKKHGRGTIKFSNGDVFEGTFFMDQRHGPGTYFLLVSLAPQSPSPTPRANSITADSQDTEIKALACKLNFFYEFDYPRPVILASKSIWAILTLFATYLVLEFLLTLFAGHQENWHSARRILYNSFDLKDGGASGLSHSGLAWLVFYRMSRMYVKYFPVLRAVFFLLFKKQFIYVSAELIEVFSLFFVSKFYVQGFGRELWWFGWLLGILGNIGLTLVIWFS